MRSCAGGPRRRWSSRCIALFVSLSGVSYGVATGFIDSREIKNNEIRSLDIRNNEIRTRDLRNNEVRGIDIRNSTVQRPRHRAQHGDRRGRQRGHARRRCRARLRRTPPTSADAVEALKIIARDHHRRGRADRVTLPRMGRSRSPASARPVRRCERAATRGEPAATRTIARTTRPRERHRLSNADLDAADGAVRGRRRSGRHGRVRALEHGIAVTRRAARRSAAPIGASATPPAPARAASTAPGPRRARPRRPPAGPSGAASGGRRRTRRCRRAGGPGGGRSP